MKKLLIEVMQEPRIVLVFAMKKEKASNRIMKKPCIGIKKRQRKTIGWQITTLATCTKMDVVFRRIISGQGIIF